MKLRVDVPDVRRFAADTLRALEFGVTAGVRSATEGLKQEIRQQVEGAGLGPRLGNAVRSRMYPVRGNSLGAAGIVYPSGVGKIPRVEQILDAFDRGVTIRSSRGLFLAVPTEQAGRRRGGRRETPGEWERRNGLRLRFVYRRGGASLLVIDNAVPGRGGRGYRDATRRRQASGRKPETVVIFLLLPVVRLGKRLDLESLARKWADQTPELIARAVPQT
jgi:hypothetical protein